MAKINEAKNTAFRIPLALIVFVVLVLALVLAVSMLYPVARDHYFALRNDTRLTAEETALKERNAQILAQTKELESDAGIESQARERWGWVKEGEEAVNITGLSTSGSSTKLPLAIESGSVEAPESWWIQSLDDFFGFEEQQRAEPYSDDTIPGL